MMNPMVSLAMVRDEWHACYAAERLESLYAEPVPLLGVLTRTDGRWADVPAKDRVWTAVRVLEHKAAVRFAVWCAEWAIAASGLAEQRLSDCCLVLRGWLSGGASGADLGAAVAAAVAVWRKCDPASSARWASRAALAAALSARCSSAEEVWTAACAAGAVVVASSRPGCGASWTEVWRLEVAELVRLVSGDPDACAPVAVGASAVPNSLGRGARGGKDAMSLKIEVIEDGPMAVVYVSGEAYRSGLPCRAAEAVRVMLTEADPVRRVMQAVADAAAASDEFRRVVAAFAPEPLANEPPRAGPESAVEGRPGVRPWG